MTVPEAAQLLDLPADASPEQIQARFLDLRTKLEDKIAKAPTPGLKEKYRTSLSQLTEAFETLTLAADSSLLPLLEKTGPATPAAAGGAVPGASPLTAPAPGPAAPAKPSLPRPSTRKSGGKEFALVAVLAVLTLAAGGWFVLKTRAENAEKARLAVEAKLEAERLAEAKRQADEQEKIRLAAAEKADRERQDKLVAEQRTELAAARIAWESWEKEERNAERALAELKGELRSLRDAPAGRTNELQARVAAAQRYYDWLTKHLEQHPARLARAKVEELLSARMTQEAGAALLELKNALAALARDVPAQRTAQLALVGSVAIKSEPSGLAWTLVDAFGRTQSGTTPATANGVAPGTARVTFSRPGFRDVVANADVRTGATANATAALLSQQVSITAEPDVEIWANGKFYGRGQVKLANEPPGTCKIELRRANFPAYRTTTEIKQEFTAYTLNYRFSDLAREDRACPTCNERGYIVRTERCSTCNGRGNHTCSNCGGRGFFTNFTGDLRINCQICGGDGRETCRQCTKGKYSYQDPCKRCAGDGRVSQLQLSQ